jgi:hypothetical protein
VRQGFVALIRMEELVKRSGARLSAGLRRCLRAVPAFELAISQAIFHSKDLSEYLTSSANKIHAGTRKENEPGHISCPATS